MRLTEKKQQQLFFVLALVLATFMGGCASDGKTNNKSWASAIKVGVVGAIGGALLCDGDAKCIVAGAVAGAAVGYYLQKRRENAKEIAEEHDIQEIDFRAAVINGRTIETTEMTLDELDDTTKGGVGKILDVYDDDSQKPEELTNADSNGMDNAPPITIQVIPDDTTEASLNDAEKKKNEFEQYFRNKKYEREVIFEVGHVEARAKPSGVDSGNWETKAEQETQDVDPNLWEIRAPQTKVKIVDQIQT